MKKVHNLSELKAGDTIVSVIDGKLKLLHFVSLLSTNSNYAIVLDEYYNGAPKFYNNNFTYENWFLYTGSKDDWIQIYNLMIEYHKKDIEYLKLQIKEISSSAKPSTL